MAAGPRIGIDFGTSHTVALMAWPDGRVRPLLFDGSPLLPSAVYAQPDGQLLVGRDAVHAARVDPARFEASPKRRIDDGTVLLGDQEFAVPALIAAVLSYVAQEANRVGGGAPTALTLTHPAAWGVSRRLALIEGAKLAGLPEPLLVPEPVAAASYFTDVVDHPIAADHGVLVYDFGGGTFDASLVIRNASGGFDVRAVDGIDDLGGVDLDQIIVDYARERVPDADLWQRLTNPQSTEDRRSHRLLWDDARMTKEMLSRSTTAGLHLPIVATDVAVPREAFEDRARPLLEQTVRTTSAVLRWSQLDKAHLAGLFLVGGSSRIPLVATLLERELGIKPTVIEQPEMVVAEGSLRLGRAYGPGTAPQSPRQATQGAGAPGLPQNAQPGQPAQGAYPGPQAFQSTPPAAPVSAAPISAAPMSASPVSGTPMSASPVSGTPISASPISASPISASPISGTPISGGPSNAAAMPMSAPPMNAPPVSGPPMSAPPISAPPNSRPQVGGPPISAAPISPTPMNAPTAIRPQQPVHQNPQQPVNVWSAGTYGPPQPQAYQQPQVYAQPPVPIVVQATEPPGKSRNVLIPVLAALLVFALVGAGWLILAATKKTAGTPQANGTSAASQPSASAGDSTAPATTFTRVNPPTWLPNGWSQLHKEQAGDTWISQKEPEGGECKTDGDSLHIVTDNDTKKQLTSLQFTGCELQPNSALNNQRFTDVGVEAGMKVDAGCGGMSLRTGSAAYMLAICRGHVNIQLLGATPADTKQLSEDWQIAGPAVGTTFAFVAAGETLTAYMNGQQLGSVTDGSVTRGKVNLVSTSDKSIVGNARFIDVRVFYPASGGGNTQTYSPPKTPKASATAWPSRSAAPSTTPLRTPSPGG